MTDPLVAELDRARELSVADLADAIESIGFECTRCGACCRGHGDDEHTATVFPGEVRTIGDSIAGTADEGATAVDHEPHGSEQVGDDETRSVPDDTQSDGYDTQAYDWRDVARPMPFGLEGDELEGETFEWALQTDGCGNCAFYTEDQGVGACTIHEDRPLICATYPFSVALEGTSQPMGDPVDEDGVVRAHECEGLGREISRADAEALAETLRERAIRELQESIALLGAYEPVDTDEPIVVHDSEGPKSADGRPLTDGDSPR